MFVANNISWTLENSHNVFGVMLHHKTFLIELLEI